MMDEAENYAELLVSDAAASVFSNEDAQDAQVQANKMKEAFSLAQQCQNEIFNGVSHMKKKNPREPDSFPIIGRSV